MSFIVSVGKLTEMTIIISALAKLKQNMRQWKNPRTYYLLIKRMQ